MSKLAIAGAPVAAAAAAQAKGVAADHGAIHVIDDLPADPAAART
jgi:hypothetical protein